MVSGQLAAHSLSHLSRLKLELEKLLLEPLLRLLEPCALGNLQQELSTQTAALITSGLVLPMIGLRFAPTQSASTRHSGLPAMNRPPLRHLSPIDWSAIRFRAAVAVARAGEYGVAPLLHACSSIVLLDGFLE